MPPAGPVKILHIITRLDLGGSAENTLLTAIGLANKGHDLTIICGRSDNPPSSNEKKAVDAGVKIIRMRSLARRISPGRDLVACTVLWWHLMTRRYHIVHTHTSKAGVVGRVAARFAPVRRLVHTPHGHIFYGYFSAFLTGFFVWVEWLLIRWTSVQITLTHKEKEDYLLHGIGPERKNVPVFSGIELTRFLECRADGLVKRREMGLRDNDFVVGTVARLVPVKNHILIVRAADLLRDRVPELRCLFVGDGDLRAPLEAEVARLGLRPHFHFAGWRDDIAELHATFDVFAMTSKNEGMGRAFVEAQACGVPVIGTRVGGVGEVLSEGWTGFLIEPDNAAELADKLAFLHTNRDALARLAANCKDWVRPRFSHDVMVDKIEKIYLELLEPKRRSGVVR
ncbi:MAG: glycosyltransferase [Chitinivibrionales bacterium]|nr:glycosyltransferase [Chitinivibrionales bacterium]MBD3396753.1 glycosyltransferase [Chitinivibrionales bacterium]